MDGVVYRGKEMVPGTDKFIAWLEREGKDYLFLTNASALGPAELSDRLYRLGLKVGKEHFYTSAMATAAFVNDQMQGASAYVIGADGLVRTLTAAGIRLTDKNPDYVIVGATHSINYEQIARASILVRAGARFIGTNRDFTYPTETGDAMPACASLVASIEAASGISAYYVGKPNPYIMRKALDYMKVRAEDAVMIGDTVETDIRVGVESGLDTVFVLSGTDSLETLRSCAYQPRYILPSIGDIASE